MNRTEIRGLPAFTNARDIAPSASQASAVAANEDNQELSARENEVMHWVKMGKTNHEIGSILEISAFTVKNHLQRIFRKLEALNRTHAVARYERTEQVVRR